MLLRLTFFFSGRIDIFNIVYNVYAFYTLRLKAIVDSFKTKNS